MNLQILLQHLETLQSHAARTYPEECCGVLIGRFLPGVEGSVVESIVSLDNERQDSRHNRYLIHPETVLAAQKEARQRDLEIVGYYHSHPDHPAVPSDFDREHAWPGMSYLIVSVQQGEVAETRSWRLADDRSRFNEEGLQATTGSEVPASTREEVAG